MRVSTRPISFFISSTNNIAFKAAKMNETAIETQAAFVTRGVGEEVLSLEHARVVGRYGIGCPSQIFKFRVR